MNNSKIRYFFIIISLFFIVSGFSELIVDYYYSETCPHCKNVLNSGILERIEQKYGETIVVRKIDVSKNVETFLSVVKSLDLKPGVPFLLIYPNNYSSTEALINAISSSELNCYAYLQGDEPIITQLEKKLESIFDCCANNLNIESNEKCENTYNNRTFIRDLFLVFSTGLADSVNPCIMSVLILLVSYLFTLKRKRQILIYGLLYVLVVFFSYLVIGLLIYKGIDFVFKFTLSISWFSKVLLMVIIALCIFAGVVNIKDFFAYGKGFSFRLSEKNKRFVEKIIRRISITTVIILSIFVTVVEFPCSGIMYVGIISYLFTRYSFFTILLLLILYNILFVLPLIIIVISALIVNDITKVERFRITYRKWFRLIIGIMLIFIAIYLIRVYFSG
ncbi:MAG: hypothetical protein QXD62_01195 [Candidatus Woesearchaeota archaeon]